MLCEGFERTRSGNVIWQLSPLILVIVLFSFGCAHKATSSLSPTSPEPSLQEVQPTIAATAEQSPSKSEKVATDSTKEDSALEEDPDFEEEFEEELDLFKEEIEEEIVSIRDPLEPVNRAIFHFNDRLYFWLLKPAARGYNSVFPEDFRICVRNFFLNLMFPIRFVNCVLQGNFRGAGIELSRFAMNSTIGLGGLFDPSSRGLNLPMQNEDVGQTLGVWRLGHGFFINLPILGPSSVREGLGILGDNFLNPISYVNPWLLGWGIKGYKKFNTVSLTLGDYEALKEAAIDPYVAVRNAYIQYRETLVKERGVFPEKLE